MSTSGLQQTFVTTLTDVRTATEGPAERVGTVRCDYNGDRFKYVKYVAGAGSVACTAGCAVVYDGNHTDVSKDFTEGNTLAGVALAVIPTNGYGWIKQGGMYQMPAAFITGTPAAGQNLVPDTSADGKLAKAAETVVTRSYASMLTAGGLLVMLDCP